MDIGDWLSTYWTKLFAEIRRRLRDLPLIWAAAVITILLLATAILLPDDASPRWLTGHNRFDTVGLLGVFFAFLIAVDRYHSEQAHARRDNAAKEFKEFLDDQNTMVVHRLIDWTACKVTIKDVVYGKSFTAIWSHRRISRALRTRQESRPGRQHEPGQLEFSLVEASLRTSIDLYLQGLEYLLSLQRNGLIDRSMLREQMGYWLHRLCGLKEQPLNQLYRSHRHDRAGFLQKWSNPVEIIGEAEDEANDEAKDSGRFMTALGRSALIFLASYGYEDILCLIGEIEWDEAQHPRRNADLEEKIGAERAEL